MKWRVGPRPLFDYSQWHSIFLFKPMEIDGYKYFLQFVWRRADFAEGTTLEQQKYLVESDLVHWIYDATDDY